MRPDWLRKYVLRPTWLIVPAMVLLVAIGVFSIGAYEQQTHDRGMMVKQVLFAVVGTVAFVAAASVPYMLLGRAAYPLFALTLVLLLAMVLVPRYLSWLPGVSWLIPNIRGAHRWINLGPIMFQPSEVAKLTFIVLLAWYLRYGDHYRRLRGLLIPFVLTLVPMGLILVEPDLGTSLLLLPTLYFMLFMAGAKLRHLLGIVAVATLVLLVPVPRKLSDSMRPAERADREALAYVVIETAGGTYAVSAAPLALMAPHQIRRIDGWLRQSDPAVAGDEGYQLRQSKMIMAVGSLSGGGGWNEKNQFYRTLPDGHTDFIYAVIGGRWGLCGTLGVLGLYCLILLCGIEVAVSTNDPFGRLLAVGVVGLLLSQLVINVGMTVGLMPITGMTLPLVSYGGTSLVINCVALGLLVNVDLWRPVSLAPRPFEHKDPRGPDAPFGPMSTGEPEKC